MSTRTWLEIYFGINLFMSGYYLGDESGWGKSKIKIACRCVGLALSGIVWVSLILLWMLVKWAFTPAWKWLDENTMIPFYIGYYLLGTYKNMPEEALMYLNNRQTQNADQKGTMKYERWQKAINLVNKLNNYTPNDNTQTEE